MVIGFDHRSFLFCVLLADFEARGELGGRPLYISRLEECYAYYVLAQNQHLGLQVKFYDLMNG